MKDLKLERYLREYSDPDVVAILEIELYVKKDIGENRIVKLPLSKESTDITFDELGDIASEYYDKKLKSDETYGYAYKIIEN
tara:strand:- start:3674 stop:3919 length:246 start_codon:yes stop_codon:yes gene_type:complete